MRFNLRLHGRTADGQQCRADVSVFASSQQALMEQAQRAAEKAAWLTEEPPHDPIAPGAHISVEHVERV
jgi:hypothetical protein